MTDNLLARFSVPKQPGASSITGGPPVHPSIKIDLNRSSKLFVVGPNGAGKSALLNHWIQETAANQKIIRAHRTNWMRSSAVDISPQQYFQTEQNYIGFQREYQSRYTDEGSNYITTGALFGLMESRNKFGDKAVEAINQADPNEGDGINTLKEKFKTKNNPIGRLNNILDRGSLNIQISIGENQRILASKNGKTYESSQLSDGERNALILSCHILYSHEETVFFIDEPEQHLHRAIAAPLLSALFSERPDCAFVIFTHELSLVEEIPETDILVLHRCYWNNDQPAAWDCNFLKSDEDISNDTRHAILGGRKQILFVEGDSYSLDLRLYKVIYPNFTVQPVGGCAEVIRAVKGLQNSSNCHWVEAYGIIDGDGRSESDIQSLRQNNIFVLQEFSVESLVYGREARGIIAKNKTREIGGNEEELSSQATENALSALSDQSEHLAERRLHEGIRQSALQAVQNWKENRTTTTDNIKIDISSPIPDEQARFTQFLKEKNLDGLIARYPVRESGALNAIAKALHYQSCNDYVAAVIQLAKNDEQFRDALKAKLPDLGSEVAG